jgi:hypothetical protein
LADISAPIEDKVVDLNVTRKGNFCGTSGKGIGWTGDAGVSGVEKEPKSSF